MTLPPQCRRAFELRKVDGLSYKEIAKRMKLSPSTIEKHVATGLLKCMDTLRRKGYNPADFGDPKRNKGRFALEKTTSLYITGTSNLRRSTKDE